MSETPASQSPAGPRIPTATYRLQFSRAFGFRDAHALVPYLHALGISDVYASPILKSRPGSHGYDVCDHSQLNSELGSPEDFDAFSAALRERGMGLILDTVPNHMGIDTPENVWWLDVLENGPSSAYAAYFDIQWQPVKRELENRVLIPILGDQYGSVLEKGEFRLAYEDGSFAIYYYEHKLPVTPRSYSHILQGALERLGEQQGSAGEHGQELQSILTALSYLPPRTETQAEKLAERNREKEVVKRRLNALYQASDAVRAEIDASVAAINGTPGDARSFDRLDALIEAQAARPSYWRVASEEINYRRFFDVNDLAALRVERPEVFDATHVLIMRLLGEGKATGLRIDHPDGLWNPSAYFRALQSGYLLQTGRQEIEAAQTRRPPLYVVAEKILSQVETLPEEWAVYGTTGYDFLNQVNGLFVDPTQRQAFDRLYRRFTGLHLEFARLAHDTRMLIMRVALVSEIATLSHQLERLAARNRHYRDFTLQGLTTVLREVIAHLPVYRTYVNALTGTVPERDCDVVEAAVAAARHASPRTDASVFDFVSDTLLLRNLQRFREDDRGAVASWVMKFQQLTGPVMAKGVEDTAFYVFNRLVALNEVGGHPDRFGVSTADFHRQNAVRLARWPHSLLATSTHDTKRGEDVRARLTALSEMPRAWQQALRRWSRFNARQRGQVNGRPAPDRNDEYLFYQTVLGAWPAEPPEGEALTEFCERLVSYMRKATKEAKVHTSWLYANDAYDAAVEAFVRRVLDPAASRRFLDDVRAFQHRLAVYGRCNSLAQTVLKLSSPGVPDVYQGSEFWDLSLVDPDNRRPVDYARREALLAALDPGLADGKRAESERAMHVRTLRDTPDAGGVKLYVLARMLHMRRTQPRLFAEGEYVPLEAQGEKREHVVAFARRLPADSGEVLVAVPRLVVRLTGGEDAAGEARAPLGAETWSDTWLVVPHAPAGRHYRNVFTGGVLQASERDGVMGLALADVFAEFPVGVLTAEEV